jgi:predicted Zn-ribbon and HTH transcriptional regulator
MPTIRQQMIDLLSQEACGVRDLSRLLGISEKEVYIHLPHIHRTVTSSGRRFHITPAVCLSCGYVFSKRSRFTRPSRCVRCKNERISEPLYQILDGIP